MKVIPKNKKGTNPKKKIKLKIGNLVIYSQLGKKIKTTVLKVKPNGDLILNTKRGKNNEGTLCKNVCVKPHRVTKV